MSAIYHSGNRELQDRFDTRRLADRLDEAIVGDTIDDNDKRFMEGADMFFIATADELGRPNCSYKGGEPGFIRVLDQHTIAFPNYDGNGMYLTIGNLLVNPHVGLLFIDFEAGHRMRLNGEASIDDGDPLMADFPEAQFIVRVRAREVFPNCPRYIHHYQRVALSRFVPQAECETPVPSWKKGDWVADVLPEHDRARDESIEVIDR